MVSHLNGPDVVISHNGRRATVLRGAAAERFLAAVETDDPQELMARTTGNDKHGNERTASNHPAEHGPLIRVIRRPRVACPLVIELLLTTP